MSSRYKSIPYYRSFLIQTSKLNIEFSVKSLVVPKEPLLQMYDIYFHVTLVRFINLSLCEEFLSSLIT